MSRWQKSINQLGLLPDYMLLGNERVVSGDRAQIESCDPGSGLPLVRVPVATHEDVDTAVNLAYQASKGEWLNMQPKDRCHLLWNAGELIRSHSERLSIIECLDTGKPLRDAQISVERTADFFCYYAGLVDKLQGDTIPLGPSKVCLTELIPVGVTGHIVPWNVPISMVARSLAPALACGNTAVIKPAEDTPITAILLAELLIEAGVPEGVVNVVTGYGYEAGAALSQHPMVRHLTFTGSVDTGKTIMKAAADHLANVTLELGGKSPHLILEDVDIDQVIPSIKKGIFSNAGQICSSGSRLLVESSIHQQLLEKLSDSVQKMSLGHGLDNPDMGPLISARQLETVSGYVERSIEQGASVVCGGSKINVPECKNGNFYAPTIIDDVKPDDEINQCEIFGPVLTVLPVEGVEHAIEVANNSAFGLAAGVHTKDISRALRFARGVETGQVYINGYHSAGDTVPFGGIKDSGIGREKGVEALKNYCDVKAMTITL